MFKNVLDPDILYLSPHDAVGTTENKIKLLEAFNGDWKKPDWRNIIHTGKNIGVVRYGLSSLCLDGNIMG